MLFVMGANFKETNTMLGAIAILSMVILSTILLALLDKLTNKTLDGYKELVDDSMRIIDKYIVYVEVLTFFKGDMNKTSLWFNTNNPLLGNIKPADMIKLGRVSKLKSFVTETISENYLN